MSAGCAAALEILLKKRGFYITEKCVWATWAHLGTHSARCF